jgi:hypothetical protein
MTLIGYVPFKAVLNNSLTAKIAPLRFRCFDAPQRQRNIMPVTCCLQQLKKHAWAWFFLVICSGGFDAACRRAIDADHADNLINHNLIMDVPVNFSILI